MPPTTTTADRPHVPTLAEIEQRRAELHRLAGRPQPRPLVRPSEPEIDPLPAKQSPHAPPPPQFPQATLSEAACSASPARPSAPWPLRRLHRGYIADRIEEAIDRAPLGLSKTQINSLFHGRVGSGRIDTALAQFMSLGALGCSRRPHRRPHRHPLVRGSGCATGVAARRAVQEGA